MADIQKLRRSISKDLMGLYYKRAGYSYQKAIQALKKDEFLSQYFEIAEEEDKPFLDYIFIELKSIDELAKELMQGILSQMKEAKERIVLPISEIIGVRLRGLFDNLGPRLWESIIDKVVQDWHFRELFKGSDLEGNYKIEDYDDKSLILHRITTIDIVPKDFRLFTAEQREKYIQSLVAELYTQKENWHFINTKFGLDTDNEEGMADYMAFRKIIDERKRIYGMISEAFYVTDERGFCHYIGEVAEKEEEYDEDEAEGWED